MSSNPCPKPTPADPTATQTGGDAENVPTGFVLVVSSPSGAGKTTLCRRLLSQHPELAFSVSYTTRRPRPGERNGEDYHFVSEAVFDEMIRKDAFAEWNLVHGNRYGTAIATIQEALVRGTQVLLDVDYQGAARLRQVFPDSAHLVFILPPSLAVLEARLRGRKTDTEEVITKRLNKARQELGHFGLYHYLVVNDDLETGYRELAAIYQVTLARARGLTPWPQDAALCDTCQTSRRQALAEQIAAGADP